MRHSKLYPICIALYITFSGCGHGPQDLDIEVTRASLQTFSKSDNQVADKVAMVYNINKQNQTLVYKAVKVEESSGNPMRDALNIFFEENNIANYYDHMRLESISQQGEKTVYSFSGKPKFQNSADSAIFWKALDITIARNTDDLNYIIEMKEEDIIKK